LCVRLPAKEPQPLRGGWGVRAQLLGNQADRRDRRGTVRRGSVMGAKKRSVRRWTARSRLVSACSAAMRRSRLECESAPRDENTGAACALDAARVEFDTAVSPWGASPGNVGLLLTGRQREEPRGQL